MSDKRTLLFMCVEEPGDPWPGDPEDMSEMSPAGIVQMIAHTALYGGSCEIYVTPTEKEAQLCLCEGKPDYTPVIGFVFRSGLYTGYGLGDDSLEELADELLELYSGEPFLMFDGDEKLVDDGNLAKMLERALQPPVSA